MDRAKSRLKRYLHPSRYHVYCQSYGHINIKSGSYFVFSGDDSKKLVKAWVITDLKDHIEFFQKMVRLIDFGDRDCEISRVENKNTAESVKKITKTLRFQRLASC